MIKRTSVMACLCWLLIPGAGNGQEVVRPTASILGFEVSGIRVDMSPDEARSTLLAAGFAEKEDPADWGKLPVGTFKKGGTEVAIAHYDGEIVRLNEIRVADSGSMDYAGELQSIRSHFSLSGADAAGCKDEPIGARCSINDGNAGGAVLTAALTSQMIFIQAARRP